MSSEWILDIALQGHENWRPFTERDLYGWPCWARRRHITGWNDPQLDSVMEPAQLTLAVAWMKKFDPDVINPGRPVPTKMTVRLRNVVSGEIIPQDIL